MNRLIDVLRNYFLQRKSSNTTKHQGIQPGSIYGVSSGKFTGKFFVYMEEADGDKWFLVLPDMTTQRIPDDKFKTGIDNKIIELQEVLPRKVYNICKQQYEKSSTKPNN